MTRPQPAKPEVRPTDIRIQAPQRPLSAGALAEFECVARGARPPARLSWSRNGRSVGVSAGAAAVRNFVDHANANASHSVLTLHLDAADHNSEIGCRAEPTEWAADESLDDSVTITVQCK